MTVFNNLLKLYNRGSSLRTPMEDFCTESLAGVLNSDKEILSKFAKEVLNLPEEKYSLNTRQSYFNSDAEQSIVDMVFESETQICFLEMKVHAPEGTNQLEKYRRQLNELEFDSTKQRTLRYCTLYHDPKTMHKPKRNYNFDQFRWKTIAEFLKKYVEENQLVHEFYQFLKENRMAGNERFTYQDLIGLQVYADVTDKVNEILNRLEKPLEEYFGKTTGINATSQIINHKRLAKYCRYVIGVGDSEVLVAFDLRRNTYGEGPVVCVQLYLKNGNSSFEKVKKAAATFEGGDFVEIPEQQGGSMRFEKPLALFIEEENQITEIVNWLEKHLLIIVEFKDLNPDIGWK